MASWYRLVSEFIYLVLFQGMDIIETMDPAAFSEYLKKYQNTICGRHPIGVLLNVSTACVLVVFLLKSSCK